MPARDVFICHARDDRFTHAQPLVAALSTLGISSWIDEGEVLPGRSLIDAINDGLGSARYVVILVTENFLKYGWRQKELNGALEKEIRTNTTVVLPVLDVDHDLFAERYPLMADKLALSWSEGIPDIAASISRLFPRHPAPAWHAQHPKEFVGRVWVRVLPDPSHPKSVHHVSLYWGPYERHVEFEPAEHGPTSFAHHKTQADEVTLHVLIDPPAVVTFGQGAPPDSPEVDVDEGWTRTAGGSWAGDL